MRDTAATMKDKQRKEGGRCVSSRADSSPRSRPTMAPNRLFSSQLEIVIKAKSKSKKRSQTSSDGPSCGTLDVTEKTSPDLGSSAVPNSTEPVEDPTIILSDSDEDLSDEVSGSREGKVTERTQNENNSKVGKKDSKSPVTLPSSNPCSHEPPNKNKFSEKKNDTSKTDVSERNSTKQHRKSCPTFHQDDKLPSQRRTHSTVREKRPRSTSSRRERSITPKRGKPGSLSGKRQSSPVFTESSRSSRFERSASEKDVKNVKKSDFKVNVYDSSKVSPYSAYLDGDGDSPSLTIGQFKHSKKGDDHAKLTSSSIVPKKHSSLTPLSKMSSSENYIAFAVSSESEEEIIDHKIITVRDNETLGSCSSLCSTSDSVYSKSSLKSSTLSSKSSVNQSSPVVEALRPDTAYKLPSTPVTPSWPYNSPSTMFHPSPINYPASFFANTPPPPMSQGTFRWPLRDDILTPSPNQANTGLFAPSPDLDKRYQCIQNLHNPPKPSLRGYQLIGDSMLLRFSNQILGESQICAETIRFLGLCVSGQRIGELLRRLKNGFYHVGKKVVLMIGTNDILKHTSTSQMCRELDLVVKHLQAKTEEVVLLTLPPVPLLQSSNDHWIRLHAYNKHIKEIAERDSGLCVLDISPLYIVTQEELEEEELVAEFNSKTLFCHGCMTCMEENEDCDSDYSTQSDEDEIQENTLLPKAYSNSWPSINSVDIYSMFVDKRIPSCRLENFEQFYSEGGRKDFIHLNFKGLTVVRDELLKKIC